MLSRAGWRVARAASVQQQQQLLLLPAPAPGAVRFFSPTATSVPHAGAMTTHQMNADEAHANPVAHMEWPQEVLSAIHPEHQWTNEATWSQDPTAAFAEQRASDVQRAAQQIERDEQRRQQEEMGLMRQRFAEMEQELAKLRAREAQERAAAEPDFTAAETYKLTTVAPHEAYTLHPRAYVSEGFYEVEKKRVFGKSWVCIGLADQVRNPGDTIVAELAGQPIFAVRDKHGALNGFLNVCRHRGSILVKKSGRYPVISCPYHRWGYALDGRLLATPMWDTTEGGMRVDKATGERSAPKPKTGRKARQQAEQAVARTAVEAAEQQATAAHEAGASKGGCSQMAGIMAAYDTAHITGFDKKDFSLFSVRVEQWGALVFATLADEEEVPALSDCLGAAATQVDSYPLADLVSVRSKSFQPKANWKLLVENFAEYYHLPTVHPALTTVSAVDNHHRTQGPGMYMGFVTYPLISGGQPIDPGTLDNFPGLQGAEHETGVFHHLFPNVFYFLLPSHMFVVRLEPKGPGVTVEHADLLVHPDLLDNAAVKEETAALNAKLDAIMEFYDMVNQEDIDACELVQEGVRAESYEGGRVAYRFEETIHRFQNMLIDHMTGSPGRVPRGDETMPFYVGARPADEARSMLAEASKA